MLEERACQMILKGIWSGMIVGTVEAWMDEHKLNAEDEDGNTVYDRLYSNDVLDWPEDTDVVEESVYRILKKILPKIAKVVRSK